MGCEAGDEPGGIILVSLLPRDVVVRCTWLPLHARCELSEPEMASAFSKQVPKTLGRIRAVPLGTCVSLGQINNETSLSFESLRSLMKKE